MSYTPNLKLRLTPEEDTSTTFAEWLDFLSGENNNSNINKIDKAMGNLSDSYNNLQSETEFIADKVFKESPQTWKDVQSIVRNGLASQYFDIGDQFIVERAYATMALITGSTGITSAAVDQDRFISAMGEAHAGEYLFTYDGARWRNESGDVATLSRYGISVVGTPKAGDRITVLEYTNQLIFDVIGFDHDTPADENYTHSMTLQMHDLWKDKMCFDAPEATWFIDEATYPNGLAAGTYHFSPSLDSYYGGDKTFNFTLTKKVPVGGTVRLDWTPDSGVSGSNIITYESTGDLEILETVSIIEGEAGAAMPTIDMHNSTDNTNSAAAYAYGSNDWSTSNIRQWLNSEGAAGTWWQPQTVFDRPGNENKDGFLKGLDPAFLATIGLVNKQTVALEEGENTTKHSSDMFFLLSRSEVYGDKSELEGSVYDLYNSNHSDMAEPGIGSDSNRVKYLNGTLADWWLRGTNGESYTNIVKVHLIKNSGSIEVGSAYQENGVSPACVII